MTDEEIIEYVVKGKEDPHENETADLAAVILEEDPERETQKSSQEDLIHHLSWSLKQLRLRKWFDVLDKSYPMLVTNCLILDNMVLLMLNPVPRKWCHLRMTLH